MTAKLKDIKQIFYTAFFIMIMYSLMTAKLKDIGRLYVRIKKGEVKESKFQKNDIIQKNNIEKSFINKE